MGDKARKELLKKKLDTGELYTNPQQTLLDLMQGFSLQDTEMYANKHLLSLQQVPLNSKKSLCFLKDQYSQQQAKKILDSKLKRHSSNLAKIKDQRLRIIEQGNALRHRTNQQFQMNLLSRVKTSEDRPFNFFRPDPAQQQPAIIHAQQQNPGSKETENAANQTYKQRAKDMSVKIDRVLDQLRRNPKSLVLEEMSSEALRNTGLALVG